MLGPRLTTIFASVLVAIVSVAHAQSGCAIVYGDNWAFLFATPERWVSKCRAERQTGAALALWPNGTTFADAPAVMYVTVSGKDEPSLEAFAAGEQQHFRATAPKAKVSPVEPMAVADGKRALVVRLSGDPGQNHELVAYTQGPTAYFIVVLSARSVKALEEYRPAFQALLQSFAPMEQRR
ncbi:MAG TPA: hypothetical protein VJV97_06890 [Gemmatimonadaceae bacterium]|nr:hypothetical protein [Gemmatimonadaceae bacterium]